MRALCFFSAFSHTTHFLHYATLKCKSKPFIPYLFGTFFLFYLPFPFQNMLLRKLFSLPDINPFCSAHTGLPYSCVPGNVPDASGSLTPNGMCRQLQPAKAPRLKAPARLQAEIPGKTHPSYRFCSSYSTGSS